MKFSVISKLGVVVLAIVGGMDFASAAWTIDPVDDMPRPVISISCSGSGDDDETQYLFQYRRVSGDWDLYGVTKMGPTSEENAIVADMNTWQTTAYPSHTQPSAYHLGEYRLRIIQEGFSAYEFFDIIEDN